MTDCQDLTLQAQTGALDINTNDRTVGTVVQVRCHQGNTKLIGSSVIECLNTTQWSSCLPTCIDDVTDREVVILAVTCSLILVLILSLFAICFIYFLKRARTRRKRSERLAQTLERLSIRDPLDELVRRESRRSSLGGNMDDSLTSLPYNNGDISQRKMYKIWTYERDKKTFAFAENLDELIEKGRDKLGLKTSIQVLLEEDGTEIDTDEILRACAGKVLLLKPINDTWTNAPRYITTLDTLPPDSTRF